MTLPFKRALIIFIIISSQAAKNTSKTFAVLLKAQKLNLCVKFLTTDPFFSSAVIQTARSTRTSSKSLLSMGR